MKKQKRVEFSTLLAELRTLSVEELLMLYIESKTGNSDDIEELIYEGWDLVDDLVQILNKHYLQKNTGAPFKGPNNY